MAPSTSSFLDLKAQLSKQEAEFLQARALGKETIIRGGVQRPDKKPTIWARQNKGVTSRNARDLEWANASKPILGAAKDAIERKTLLYDMLKKGKTAGLSEEQINSIMVDFDRKAEEEGHSSDSSQDIDPSVATASLKNDDDPIVEYEDEFGRTRRGRRSEIPRNLSVQNEETPEDDPYLIRGNVDHFPTYSPSAEKVAAVEAAVKEDANPATHYDATQEVRPQGAGFYQFSKDEETRQRQMDDLKRSRLETESARDKSGADVGKELRPGIEKRKREIEERRKVVAAKRRKIKDPTTERESFLAEDKHSGRAAADIQDGFPQSADEFLATLERDMIAEKKKAGQGSQFNSDI